MQSTLFPDQGGGDYHGARGSSSGRDRTDTDYLPPSNRTFGAPQSLRVNCGNCDSPFSVAGSPPQHQQSSGKCGDTVISCLSCGTSSGAAGLIAARCPHCRKITSIGPAYARVRAVAFGLMALLMLIISISVTVGTAESAKHKGALYFLWIG